MNGSATERLTPSPEQQEILDLGLTTIRVRAGAGTGKTTTVAMVISGLIEDHGIEPEQILGITFTNKAAAELADRIRQTLRQDVDPGRQVEVHTYHGFAAQILAEFGPLAGVDNRAKVITPTFSRQLLTDTFHHRAYRYLDITQPRTLDRIRRLGDRLGDHLLTPGDILIEPFQPDDEVWQARQEMAETLDQYSADKRRLRVVDYSDLVTLSSRVVSDYPEMAEAIRDRYRAVVLDEYQDTNPAQRVLLTRIFSGGFPVIAVGDEDQTIYEWRGASAQNFEQFSEHFRGPGDTPAHHKELTLNRRSSQPILDIANLVRTRANTEAGELEAVDRELEGEVVTHWAGDALKEAEWIAGSLERLHDEGLAWADMAILFRKNKDFAVVVDALSRHDIPLEVANIGGLLAIPEVADIRAWLTSLEHPEDSASLTQILFGSKYSVGMADLAPLTRWQSAKEEEEESEEPAPITLMEAIESANQIEGLRPEAVEAFARFAVVYRELLAESQGLTLVEICRLILDRTRAWQDIDALPPNPRLTARLNIYRLLDLTEDWSPLEGRPSVGAFLDYLDAMEDEPADELDSARLSGEDAVTLVTVHRAKGLEWDTVAIPAVTKGNFPSGIQQHPDPIRFAEHLPVDMRIDSAMDDLPDEKKDRDDFLRNRHNSQEWRVAYVAVTRAKRRLLISGAFWYGMPEPLKEPKEPSELFELAATHQVTVNDGIAILGDRPALLRSASQTAAPDPLFTSGWSQGLRDAITDPATIETLARKSGVEKDYKQMVDDINQRLFKLADPAIADDTPGPTTVSVTGLVTMAQCPKRFFWTDVDPLPRRPNPAAIRGTQIHRRIELHQRGQVPFEEMTSELYDVADGGSGIGAYDAYLDSSYATRTADLIEAPFGFELANGYRIRGRIDAVYCEGRKWEVVDFKSGRTNPDPSRLVQLQAYAVAVNEVDFGLPPPEEVEVAFAYLGGGLDVVSYAADAEWVSTAKETLSTLTTQMNDEDFEERPGTWCVSCDFLRFCEPGQNQVNG